MSHLSQIFNSVPVKVPKRSGFDMSHENLFTAKVGTLIPASVEEVLPGDVISVGSAMNVELPPLATSFKGRVDAKLEAFFVPSRILWGGWQNFITHDINIDNNGIQGGSGTTVPSWDVPTIVPRLQLNGANCGAGTLADYLGFKGVNGFSVADTKYVNALPFVAYWKIWEDWYRDSNLENPFFGDGRITDATQNFTSVGIPYTRNSGNINQHTGTVGVAGSSLGYNGKRLYQLAQRNFAKDYFTTMTYEPQAGAGAELKFDVTLASSAATSGSTSFSIAQLRAANSLQRWLERNNIAGTRYFDQILAHYGVLPPDANIQRPVLLGSMTTPVIVNSISQTANNTSATTANYAKNPYSQSVGAQFGKGVSFGKDRLIDKFEAKEHGYIFIMFSLVPHAYYGTGSRRYLFNYKSSDYAFPEFANIGDQEVRRRELYTDMRNNGNDETVVGYVQRYAQYKYHDDEVHGLLADGQSLDSFVLQKGFDSGVTLGADFVAIPTNYMDDVMVTTTGVSGFNAVVDAYFDSKFLRVLPEYSLPSLCSAEDMGGKTINVPKGGTRL